MFLYIRFDAAMMLAVFELGKEGLQLMLAVASGKSFCLLTNGSASSSSGT